MWSICEAWFCIGPRRLGALVVVCMVAFGCSRNVHHGLTEAAANELIVALAQADIPASKKSAGDGWVVAVPRAQYARGLTVLAARNLPRTETDVLALLDGGAGLVPSAEDDRVRRRAILTAELEQTFLAMESVVDAHVHAVLPAPTAGGFDTPRTTEPVASVVLAYRAGLMPPADDAIHAILRGAVEGLQVENISTVLVETSMPQTSELRVAALGPIVVASGSLTLLRGLLVGGLALLIVLSLTAMRLAWKLEQLQGQIDGPDASASTSDAEVGATAGAGAPTRPLPALGDAS